jgi:hypothetical protein
MSVHTQTRFDLDLLKRSFESWDLEALRDLYHDDLEQIEMDDVDARRRRRVRATRTS